MVYKADQETATVSELYSVPIGGPAAAGLKLNGAMVAGGNVGLFLISPDSSRVVYWADQQTATVFELYSVPLGGPAAAGVKLNGALVAGGNVVGFQISPDSSRVVYRPTKRRLLSLSFTASPSEVRRRPESSSTGPWWQAGM